MAKEAKPPNDFFQSLIEEEIKVYGSKIPPSNSEVLMKKIDQRKDADELIPLDFLIGV